MGANTLLSSPLIQQNQEAFKRLVAFAKVAEGLTIGFIQANFAQDTNAVLAALAEHPDCQSIQFEVLTFADPNLKFLRKAILEALPTLAPNPHKKLIIIIQGLEQSIGMTGDSAPVLQDLNFVRDDLVASLPYPILLCLPDYAITRLIRFAPDLWAWKSGVFRFKSSYVTQEYALQRTLDSAQIQGSLDLSEKQTRINLLQRLLMEDQPSGHQDTVGNLKNRLMILYELGVLYHTQGEIDKAYKTLNTALALTADKDALLFGRATILHELGNLYANQGKNNQALSCYKESLKLHEQNANLQGKAATLHCIANIYASQGNVDGAFSLYKESLDLEEQIRDLRGKAATLHQMAHIYASQGALDRALSLYKESLELKEQMGNLQGKSATLHQMANVYLDLGKVDTALSLYEESLDLEEQIGDLQGKAATLHQMAHIYASQGAGEKAFSLFLESLKLEEQIGDLQGKATTLAMMGQLFIAYGDFAAAQAHLKESLEIFQHLKSPKTETIENILNQVQNMATI